MVILDIAQRTGLGQSAELGAHLIGKSLSMGDGSLRMGIDSSMYNRLKASSAAEGGFMARKAAWILMLLAVLTVLSVTVAFAASLSRPAQQLGTSAAVSSVKLAGVASANYHVTQIKSDWQRCQYEETAAY
jgi:hypothetical protein